jgi:hypothetical protein
MPVSPVSPLLDLDSAWLPGIVCVNPHHDLVCITMPVAWTRVTTFESIPLPSVARSVVRLVVRRLLVVRCARENKLFPTRLLTSEDEYKWFWHQMSYFPGTINIVSTRLYTSIMDSLFLFQQCTSTYSVHAGISKLWRGRLPCPLVVFSFHYESRLSSSFVRSQLTLPVPAMEIRSPLSQDGAPIPRVRTHSLSRVQHKFQINNKDTLGWCSY